MNARLATIALTTLFLLAQTVTAQITLPERFVQIRSIDLTTSVLELFNSGTASQSLAGWRFCTHDEDSVRRYSSAGGKKRKRPSKSTWPTAADEAGVAGALRWEGWAGEMLGILASLWRAEGTPHVTAGLSSLGVAAN